jgi:hypothetical protein
MQSMLQVLSPWVLAAVAADFTSQLVSAAAVVHELKRSIVSGYSTSSATTGICRTDGTEVSFMPRA